MTKDTTRLTIVSDQLMDLLFTMILPQAWIFHKALHCPRVPLISCVALDCISFCCGLTFFFASYPYHYVHSSVFFHCISICIQCIVILVLKHVQLRLHMTNDDEEEDKVEEKEYALRKRRNLEDYDDAFLHLLVIHLSLIVKGLSSKCLLCYQTAMLAMLIICSSNWKALMQFLWSHDML